MNVIALIGRLTADPELKQTQTGVPVSRFTIAVDRPYSKQGEERQVDFINVVAWRNSAEFLCKYFAKGQRIGVQGSVRTGSYIDESGIKRYFFEVLSDRLEFVERREKGKDNISSPPEQENEFEPVNDDLPF